MGETDSLYGPALGGFQKEVVKDIGANLAVKNKMNAGQNIEGSEIEIVFERVNVDKVAQPKKSVSIVKGSKKDILKAMENNAQE